MKNTGKFTCIAVAIAVALSMSGCTYRHLEDKDSKAVLNDALNNKLDVPDSVLNELNPDNPYGNDSSNEQTQRVSVAANNVPAAEFFAQLMEQSDCSVVVHPEVAGNITLNLDNVTIDQIFDAVYRVYGYRAEKKKGIYYVYPAGVYTETIPVNYLFLTRDSTTKMQITNNTITNSDDSGDSGDSSSSSSSSNSDSSSDSTDSSGVNMSTAQKSDFWTELKKTLEGIIGSGEGRMVQINPQASTITVRGMPSEIKAVREFIAQIENSLRRQVVIEAKILEVTLSEDYEQGINWSVIFNSSSRSLGTDTDWSGNVSGNIFSVMGGGFKLNMGDSHYSTLIRLLQTQGEVSTLSSPRITAMNNQRSVMKVGQDKYYLTDISTESSSTSSSTSNLVSSGYTFEPFFSGVALDVLPQISDDGSIIMHIHPSVVEVNDDVKSITMNGTTTELPLAKSDVRETDTIVEAKSGDVILIGGLMKHDKGSLESKVPLLGDIPWVGELFKNRSVYDEKSELVILLRPVIVGGDTWKEELKKASSLLEKWYPSDPGSRGLIVTPYNK